MVQLTFIHDKINGGLSLYVELAEPGSEEIQIPNSLLHVDTLRPIFFCKEILEGNNWKQWLKSQNLPRACKFLSPVHQLV